MYTYIINDELIHHGVKGQRWGVRKKYHKEDGSVTAYGSLKRRILTSDYNKQNRKLDKLINKYESKGKTKKAEIAKAMKKQNESDKNKKLEDFRNGNKVSKDYAKYRSGDMLALKMTREKTLSKRSVSEGLNYIKNKKLALQGIAIGAVVGTVAYKYGKEYTNRTIALQKAQQTSIDRGNKLLNLQQENFKLYVQNSEVRSKNTLLTNKIWTYARKMESELKSRDSTINKLMKENSALSKSYNRGKEFIDTVEVNGVYKDVDRRLLNG